MQAMAKNTIEKAIYNRTELLLGDDVMEALAAVRVIIFGVGGVGSWCAEGLVRSGITKLTIVDSDRICITNVNRQLMATTKTVGQVKVDALKAHLLEINPKAEVTAVQQIYCEETAGQFNLDEYDYVIDAVDSLKDKVHLILNATSSKAKFFCSLGAALKVDPLKIKVAEFWNVLLITKVSIGVHLFFRYLISPDIAPPHPSTLDTISFTFRNTVIYMAIVGIAVAVKMTTEWYNNEAQRKEIEKNQAEAELANLKNQVNPHFLFNTLNNIYSLIQIDPAQAQEAVHDLSGMLRYVLYESQKDTVPLAKECEFLNEYVKLMGARLTSGVKLEVSLPSSLSNRQIAPLLFIPLVENAFKHGISDTDESFIRIELKEDGEYVTCLVENSCFPKDDTDRSGSGIGITNLKRRLDLLYPGAYSFEYGRVQSVYRSLLRIRTGI